MRHVEGIINTARINYTEEVSRVFQLLFVTDSPGFANLGKGENVRSGFFLPLDARFYKNGILSMVCFLTLKLLYSLYKCFETIRNPL